ncbi:(deoxy)nucleoside triphosphate pyrophosphohydrolase [Flavihumibacter rivuli]|uniref:(deoxy)nucleoside triphosphate pyrophosphohydrolase n=1 Tax=Flavihumibacter rivuli TaxID=2838156 RepID=UPI001BDE9B1B|nr:(deoxy)nucleoside triphosphate pyrophosphohydrolase [Flavihumibacter rivuli]ULQ55428.1 (deoxy)nucleoside triphosphate pyrophosphohydrolase [Flavihumibacter rivuli]
MDIIKVVCGIIFNDNKVFICRRKPEKALGGYWEFPGGKIEEGETNEISLCRELFEELGMKIEVKDYFITSHHDYGNFTIELIAYRCKFIGASFQLTDHDKFEWVSVSEITKWNLAPADIPIAKELNIRGLKEYH